MSRRFMTNPFLPIIIMILLIVVIAVPLWTFFDWRERVWRVQCQAQGGHPVSAGLDQNLICVDDNDRVVWVRR